MPKIYEDVKLFCDVHFYSNKFSLWYSSVSNFSYKFNLNPKRTESFSYPNNMNPRVEHGRLRQFHPTPIKIGRKKFSTAIGAFRSELSTLENSDFQSINQLNVQRRTPLPTSPDSNRNRSEFVGTFYFRNRLNNPQRAHIRIKSNHDFP